MNRRAFIKHLRANNCLLYREGANHSIYINDDNGRMSTVPRHREIKRNIARKICKDLDIPSPF